MHNLLKSRTITFKKKSPMLLHNLKHIKRIREILMVFFEEGFGFLIKKAELHHYIPFSKRFQNALRKEDQQKPEVRLRQALERLGPTFVKLGQVLSLRPDILPIEYIEELEKMQDNVPPAPFEDIDRIVREELGRPPNELFTSFDQKPIASASLAQVYKAKIGKETVAIKVQRPNIEQTINEDSEIMLFLANWFDKRKVIPAIPLTPIIEEFKRWTLRELNFHSEATNMRIIKENFRHSKDILIPKVYDRFSKERILTTQFIEGVPFHKTKNARPWIKKCYAAVVEMVFIHGIFHADPHPGNLIIAKNRLAFIDFGIVGRINDTLRASILALFESMMNQNAEGVTDALLSLRTNKERIDETQLTRDLEELLDPIRSQQLRDIHLGEFLQQTLQILHSHKLQPPIEFILLVKTFLIVEGMGLRYSPDYKIMAETQQLMQRVIRYESSPKVIATRIKAQLQTYKKMMQKTPKYFNDTLQRLSEGRIDVEIVPREFMDLRTEFEHGTGNIAIGMMVAALMVSSSLSMQVIKKPTILDIPALSFIGFILAILLGMWLIR